MKKIRGYKAFDKNLKCRGYQYEVGHVFYEDSELPLEPCSVGIHFCENLKDVFNYYPANSDTRVCEVESLGAFVRKDDKICAREIKVLRELTGQQIKSFTDSFRFNSGNENSGNRNSGDFNSGNWNSGNRNSGDCNSGDFNSGDWNSGNRNSGHRNSGNWNSGNRNSGHRNSGDFNSGDCNSGHRNSGDFNSGNWNSGNRNSGDCNSGDRNSGCFNTDTPKVRLFNKETDLDFYDKVFYKLNQIISLNWPSNLEWVDSKNMTYYQKKAFSDHETTGGFLEEKNLSYRGCWEVAWSKMSQSDREFIMRLPNFDPAIFEEITGIDVEMEE